MAYFLISISNRVNLEICIRYALAGFTNSINGLWTFVDINENDYVSFLYGARVYNLYTVAEKIALKNADNLPPWPPVTFRMSGRSYYFPFRLKLQPIRQFTESMVRAEFAYVAENLLLRGGYRKTHFQADQTTLQSVSQMGDLYPSTPDKLDLDTYEVFIPLFTWSRSLESPPDVFCLKEIILQSIIRQWLSNIENLRNLFNACDLKNFSPENFEVLGEKAMSEGYIDILIKDAVPAGYSRKVIIEVKNSAAQPKDLKQLKGYADEMGSECLKAIIIARSFSKKVLREAQREGISCFIYSFNGVDMMQSHAFNELKANFQLLPV